MHLKVRWSDYENDTFACTCTKKNCNGLETGTGLISIKSMFDILGSVWSLFKHILIAHKMSYDIYNQSYNHLKGS